MALDAVIFDLDGTLVDTNDAHALAWHRALKQHGWNIPTARIHAEIGKGSDFLVPSLLGEEVAAQHQEALGQSQGDEFLKIAGSEKFRVFPHAVELLDDLRARGLKVALATSAKPDFLEAIQKSAGCDFSAHFDEITTADDAEQSKPAPDIVQAALGKLQLSPAQCVMVGDTPHDARACRRAGVVCFAVQSGGHATPELLSAGARRVWHDVQELHTDLADALQTASPFAGHLTQSVLENLMRGALQVARDGMKTGEVPIGALLVRPDGDDFEIIARGFNEMNATTSKIAHAEIVAFERAVGKVPADAKNLILVSTLEPCVMCTGAAMEAAVDTIIYALPAPADSGTNRVAAPQSPESQMPRIVPKVLAAQSRALFETWLSQNNNSQQAAFVRQLLALNH